MDSSKWGSADFSHFPPDPVSSFPDHDHRFSDGLIVDTPAPHGMRRVSIIATLPKQFDAVLTVMSRYSDALI